MPSLDPQSDLLPPIRCGRHALRFTGRTLIMGVINMSPDSFSGDGLGDNVAEAVRRAQGMAENGADILDVGGESTRPGSQRVPADEQIRRAIPAIRSIGAAVHLPVSIDTRLRPVAEAALQAGACIINDISALRHDPEMAALAAGTGVPVILTHMLGTPQTMQDNPTYGDVAVEIRQFLAERIAAAVEAGIAEQQLIVDPGLGFGKTVAHNLEILRRLRELRALGRPVLVGPSRKRFIGAVLQAEVLERLEGTAAAVALAIANGADIVRVHEVAQMARVARMADAIVRGHWQEPPGG